MYAALRSAPLLSREREIELAQAWQQRKDGKALSELINAHARLAIAMATNFARRSGFPIDDLIQEGLLGLMKAVEGFDPAKGFRFSTYSTFWIRASIQQYQWQNQSLVQLPETQRKKEIVRRLRRDAGANVAARAASLAQEYGVDVRQIELLQHYVDGRNMTSLQSPVGGDGNETLGDLLADDAETPEDALIAAEETAMAARSIERALKELNDRERKVIRARFIKSRKKTLDELAGELGVSRERIRQIEANAMAKMRRVIEGQPAKRRSGRPSHLAITA